MVKDQDQEDICTRKQATLSRLVKVIIAFTLIVIALGAYTRLSDAGLGCPDWPGCYGQLLVPQGEEQISKANQLYPERAVEPYKAWLEMIHRYFAGTLGLLVFAMTYLALRYTSFRALPVLISSVVIFQALLGMWTVTLKLMPVIVMAHLLGGFTLLCLLVLFSCQLGGFRFDSSPNTDKNKHALSRYNLSKYIGARKLAMISLIVVGCQIMLGGWTSSNYAALMCTSLPICEGNWWQYLDFKTAFSFIQPGFDDYEFGVLEYPARMTIHVSHRIGAVVTMLVVLGLIIQLIQIGHWRAGLLVATLLSTQIALGVANVVLHLPLINAVLHNLVAAVLLSSVVAVSYKLTQQVREHSSFHTHKKQDLGRKTEQEAYNE